MFTAVTPSPYVAVSPSPYLKATACIATRFVIQRVQFLVQLEPSSFLKGKYITRGVKSMYGFGFFLRTHVNLHRCLVQIHCNTPQSFILLVKMAINW